MVEIVWCEWFPVPKALCRQPNGVTFPLNYMSVQEALHRLKPKPWAEAAAELLDAMRSGALPTTIQCVRVRNGQTLSAVVVQYPMSAYWNAILPEILGKDGAWMRPDGDASVECYVQVDIQCEMVKAVNGGLAELGRILERAVGNGKWPTNPAGGQPNGNTPPNPKQNAIYAFRFSSPPTASRPPGGGSNHSTPRTPLITSRSPLGAAAVSRGLLQ